MMLGWTMRGKRRWIIMNFPNQESWRFAPPNRLPMAAT